ncbi:MAG: hypothetical protein HKN43_03560 [Rhodothermales bacterium]|nr:hypothetical protein [Rhodothermales bacterium]
MVSISALWLPILVSAVAVFIVGFIMNMVLPHHRNDFSKVDNEDGFQDALRSHNLTKGQYFVPYANSSASMKDPDYIKRAEKGPVALVHVIDNGVGPKPQQLGIYFVELLIISLFVAYISGMAFGPGTDYLQIFQIAGSVAVIAHIGALIGNSVWWGFTWSSTFKHMFDGVIYGLVTAGIFGWLWPGM